MSDMQNIPLEDFVNLATESSSEIGHISDCSLIDYESGHHFEAPDEQTAAFIASARSIVLELARRIRAIENPYQHLSELQWRILEAAQSDYGTSIAMSDETQDRQAFQLMGEKLLNRTFDHKNPRFYFYFITIKGRRALALRDSLKAGQ